MALKIFSFTGSNMQTAIETNTGIKFDGTYGGTGIRGCDNTKIKFPGMTDYVTLPMLWHDYSGDQIAIVDEENGYLFTVYNSAWRTSGQLTNGLWNLLYTKNGELKSFNTGYKNTSDYIYDVLMINGSYEKDNSIADSFELVAASTCEPDVIPNVYFEYEKRFSPGLKFIDQNGNKWVTLGGYMLYHYE